MSEPRVSLSIGSHTWTPENKDVVEGILNVMRAHGLGTIDTARSYVRY